jgi:hypothetical protein
MLPPGDEHDFMKNLIDNLGKFVAALSFALLTVTVLHDWGYFWLLGSRFQSIQTPYDHLANAIEWLPLHLAIFLLSLPFSFALYALTGEPEVHAFPSGIMEKTRWKGAKKSVALGGVGVLLGVLGVLLGAPQGGVELPFTVAVLLFVCYFTLLPLVAVRFPPTAVNKFVWSIPPVLVMAFLAGGLDAVAGIESSSNIYKIVPKDSPPFNANLLRSLDKGLLMWDGSAQRVILMRWERVSEISHFVAPHDKLPYACRFFQFMCPTTPIIP